MQAARSRAGAGVVAAVPAGELAGAVQLAGGHEGVAGAELAPVPVHRAALRPGRGGGEGFHAQPVQVQPDLPHGSSSWWNGRTSITRTPGWCTSPFRTP